jgi:hypothetical protein
MKHRALFLIILAFGCQSSGNDAKKINDGLAADQAMTISDIFAHAEKNIGKEVLVKGTVEHVCSHSGRRCFIFDGKNSMRIEATGNISSFKKELSGSDILVKGILREKQIQEQLVNEMAQQTHNRMSSGEQCNAELAEIQQMRDWMMENNRNYYSVWYLDGTDYEMVQ